MTVYSSCVLRNTVKSIKRITIRGTIRGMVRLLKVHSRL